MAVPVLWAARLSPQGRVVFILIRLDGAVDVAVEERGRLAMRIVDCNWHSYLQRIVSS
jgi:hypothetical protein